MPQSPTNGSPSRACSRASCSFSSRPRPGAAGTAMWPATLAWRVADARLLGWRSSCQWTSRRADFRRALEILELYTPRWDTAHSPVNARSRFLSCKQPSRTSPDTLNLRVEERELAPPRDPDSSMSGTLGIRACSSFDAGGAALTGPRLRAGEMPVVGSRAGPVRGVVLRSVSREVVTVVGRPVLIVPAGPAVVGLGSGLWSVYAPIQVKRPRGRGRVTRSSCAARWPARPARAQQALRARLPAASPRRRGPLSRTPGKPPARPPCHARQ
jgi:hypothetical protein